MTDDAFAKPLPNESLSEYLWRLGAHPEDPNRRETMADEMVGFDRTEECVAAGLAGLTFFPETAASELEPPVEGPGTRG